MYTKSAFAIAPQSDQKESGLRKESLKDYDAIPLIEIKNVVILNEDLGEKIESEESGKKLQKGPSDSELAKKTTAVQSSSLQSKNLIKITTSFDGKTTGRIYLIQASRPQECQTIAKDLETLSKDAKLRLEANSKFSAIQEKIRKVYSSGQVQGFVGVLIIAVRSNIARTINKQLPSK
jgi:hypothetical protein